MNIKTITFDSDKWQLMPSHPCDAQYKEIIRIASKQYNNNPAAFCLYTKLLELAPQPEPLSPPPKTLRDEFAIAWMRGYMANPECPDIKLHELAALAYEVADAMLEAREQKK